MTRSELIAELAARFKHLTQNDTDLAVKAIIDTMNEALVQGQRIEIRRFGSFSIKQRPARIGRNPRNGDSVEIPSKRVLHFKPGKVLREEVDNYHKLLSVPTLTPKSAPAPAPAPAPASATP